MCIIATHNHRDGYKFNIEYKTRAGFIRAVTGSKTATLDNAVDVKNCFVVTPKNFHKYREMRFK